MKARITITSDYSDQIEAKLAADLDPVLDRWIWESLNQGAIILVTSNPELPLYVHAQVQNPKHVVDGEPVWVSMLTYIERGAAVAEVAYHLGSKEHVQAIEAKHRAFMKELALQHKESALLQIDQEDERAE
jgi:hypothetical protein